MTTPNPKTSILGRYLATVLGIVAAAELYGQAAPAPSPETLAKYDKNKNGILDPDELALKASDEKDAAILMNPFNVSTDKDVGYTAGNTLSGGRVDTPLAITPSSISVMTKEFMDDFNITDMNQAGSWTIGFDLGTSVPNSDPSSISVYQNIVRGAPSADNFPTRNGDVNFGAADSYNTERFEFQRGPDTSMFGDGGPGGRQGSSSKQASFNRTATSVSLQMDSWNGHRATLDYSKGWDRIGMRFNMLNQNAPGYQAGMNKLKKAWTINVNAKLTKNTTFSAEYERTNEWNNLWSITLGDNQNFWDSVTVATDNLALLANNNTLLNAQGVGRLTVEENGSAANMFIWNYALGNMQDYGGNQYRTRGLGTNPARIPYGGNPYLLAVPARRAMIGGMDMKFTPAAKDNIAARDQDTASLNLEHRVGNLFLRLRYSRNRFDNNTIWSNTSPNGYVIDLSQLQPNGQLNPFFLHTFTDVEQSNAYSEDRTQTYTGSATYRFFKPKWWDYKQQFTVNLSNRDQQQESRNSAWRRTDNPGSADPFANANKFFYRVYWDQPRAEHASILTDPNGKALGTWAYVDTGGNATTVRNVKQGSVTGQSGFFNEKLVFTGSFSKTTQNSESQSRISALSQVAPYKNVYGTNNVAGAWQSRKRGSTSIAYGLVTYPFQFKQDGLAKTLISPLGFVINVGQNTAAAGSSDQNPLITGEEAPLTNSETKDFGLRYSIPGGKAYLTLTRYNTDQNDMVSGFGSAGDITTIWTNLGYTDPTLTTTGAGNFAYSDLSSRKLEGWEAELTANPTRNISLSINYAHPITYIAKESEDRKAYVAANRAEWEAGSKLATGTVTAGGRVIKDPGAIVTALNQIDNSLAGLTSGTIANNEVRHRINANGRYRFSEGMLKGLALTAGVQYRGHGKNGSRDPRLKFGLADNVTPTTAQTTEAAYDYLWVPPSWKSTIVAGATYTRRVGKYNYRFQLNVNNVLNNLDPIWGRSGPVGNGASAYTVITTNQFFAGNQRVQVLNSFVNPEPRKFTFTTSVSF